MSNITKKELIDKVAQNTGLTQVDTRMLTEAFFEAVSKSLIEGRNIEIRDFGRFKVKPRKARKAHNPRTGERVDVKAGVKPVFYASKELKTKLTEYMISQ